ncbi:MAG: hypothetical protein Q9228_007950 [Teloschistes exilis]
MVQKVFQGMEAKSKEQGAAMPLVAALDPKLTEASGAYLNDYQIEDVAEWAKDPEIAGRCWEWSAGVTGVKV